MMSPRRSESDGIKKEEEEDEEGVVEVELHARGSGTTASGFRYARWKSYLQELVCSTMDGHCSRVTDCCDDVCMWHCCFGTISLAGGTQNICCGMRWRRVVLSVRLQLAKTIQVFLIGCVLCTTIRKTPIYKHGSRNHLKILSNSQI